MWIFRNRKYEEFLESEVRRLQSENRQLVNSVLAVAGIPGIAEPDAKPPATPARRNWKWRDIAREQLRKARDAWQQVEPHVRAAAQRKAHEQQPS